MKRIIGTLALLLYLVTCQAQPVPTPKNLKQAVAFLAIDCPSNLQETIKHTADKNLTEFTYPWHGDYKTIFNWTKNDDDPSQLARYLDSKGISSHQEQVILIAFKHYLLTGNFNERAIYQPFRAIEQKWAAEDKVRFITDSLRGVYIPQDIPDCLRQIDSFWSDSLKRQVKSWTEDEFSSKAHLGFGTWMRNNWQLWAGSRLTRYFNALGIYHPEDMSGIILTSYHRHLQHQPLNLPAQIESYQAYWVKARQREAEQEAQKFAAYQVGDTVTYRYRLGYATKAQEAQYDEESCLAKGKIVERNTEKRWLNVQLLVGCDPKGIIASDSKNTRIYNSRTASWEVPKRRVIKYLKPGHTQWFTYDEWESKD